MASLDEPLLLNGDADIIDKPQIFLNSPLSPQYTRDRRETELIVPDVVKNIRSRSKNTFDNNISTISLSRDIFTTIVVLKAYHIWNDLSFRHRRQLLILAFICILLQFGVLFTLTIEMIVTPPWGEYETDGEHWHIDDGGSVLVIITKFFCVFSVLMYLFKELYELKAYRKLRREIQDFRHTCSKVLFSIYNIYNLLLYILAMALSVVLISTSKNGFDSVLNAVAILFVLDIDNWMYQMIKSHQYIEDELFDIKYEKHKEITSYLIAKYRWMSSVCCCYGSTYTHKADGDETFISLVSLSVWFSMIISMSLMCLGFVYQEQTLKNIGICLLIVVSVYYIIRKGFNIIGSIVFSIKNKRKMFDFVNQELPAICHRFVKQMDPNSSKSKLSNKKNNLSIDNIKEEFVEECFRYFDRNNCGMKETAVATTEKLMTAFDEYYNNCDKSRIHISQVDFGAFALGIKFKL
eukprot:240690_1